MYGGEAFAQLAFDGLWTSYAASLSENSTILDAPTTQSAFLESLTEGTINLNDIQSEQDNFFEGIVETLTQTDTSTQTYAFGESLTENFGVNSTQIFNAQFAEFITEAWGQTAYSVTELADFGGMAFGASPVAGGITVSGFVPNPTYLVQNTFQQSIIEPFTLADSSAQSFGFLQSITENTQILDSQVFTAQFIEAITENFGAAETESVLTRFTQSITENIGILDSYTAGLVILFSITENFGVADAQIFHAQFAESIIENTAIADYSTQISNFLESIAENIVLGDNNCVFGWFKINDNQVANWGTQFLVVNEIYVFGGATFGGIPFAGNMYTTEQSNYPVGYSPTIVWNQINTNESPNWTLVDNTQKC